MNSVPLPSSLALTQRIEPVGMGDMIRRCREAGLTEPGFAVSDGFFTTIWRKNGKALVAQPESLEQRVLALLANVPLAKASISAALGPISGHLNQVIRVLLADQTLEYTLPDKPTSRLQQYRLTDKGLALLATLRKGAR